MFSKGKCSEVNTELSKNPKLMDVITCNTCNTCNNMLNHIIYIIFSKIESCEEGIAQELGSQIQRGMRG